MRSQLTMNNRFAINLKQTMKFIRQFRHVSQGYFNKMLRSSILFAIRLREISVDLSG